MYMYMYIYIYICMYSRPRGPPRRARGARRAGAAETLQLLCLYYDYVYVYCVYY